MLLTIPNILESAQLAQVRELLSAANFINGRLSAGADAKRVKHNEEVDSNALEYAELNQIVMGHLHTHPMFQRAVLPNKVSSAFFVRYTEGMQYGDHIDDPVMGQGQRYRCDVATTVFFNSPAAYDGGELVITSEFGNREIKLEAGDVVVYPASSLHHVNTVTRGERLVAVAWIQSLVRESERRALLYDLDLARESLRTALPDAEVTAKINAAYVNLVRMWSEV